MTKDAALMEKSPEPKQAIPSKSKSLGKKSTLEKEKKTS
jgi:hypothetical protein